MTAHAAPQEVPPRVSVVIPNFNTAHWLPGAIASVLAQRFRDFELVVLDNGSTDDSAAVVARYDDPRVSFRVNERNIGFFGSVRKGCLTARGEFVLVIGSDDILDPGFLEAAVAFLDAEPGCAMVHGPAAWIDPQGRRFGTSDRSWARVTQGTAAMPAIFSKGFCFSSMVMRTAAIRATGPFDESFDALVDVWLFARMCLEGDVGYLDSILCEYRIHPDAMSMPLYRSNDMFHRQLAVARRIFAWPEAVANGACVHLPEAETHCARVAIEVLHMSRADGYRRWFANLAAILREVPSVTLRPATWLRIGFGLLPHRAIAAMAAWRSRRAIAREGGGTASA